MTNQSLPNPAMLLTQELLRAPSADIAQALAEVVTRLADEPARSGVVAAFRSLTDPACIDAICAVWGTTRHPALGALIEQAGWVASGPERLALLTTLKAGQLAWLETAGADVVAPLLKATTDGDPTIAGQARLALRRLANPAAQEELYRLVIDADASLAREAATSVPYAPRDAQRRALFYLLTEQWQKYDDLDFDRSLIRAVYQVSNENLQGRIADLTRRAGRLDFVDVIAGGRQRRRLPEMSEAEWAVVLALLTRHHSWADMWHLAQVAPPAWSVQFLRPLRQTGWLPEPPDEQGGLAQLAELAGQCTPEGLQLGSAARCQAILTGHTGGVYRVAMTPTPPEGGPGGQLLVSGGEDAALRLWNLPTGQALATLTGHTGEIWGLGLSPDSRLLVSGSDDDTVRLWRLPDGQLQQTLTGYLEAVNTLALDPLPLLPSAGSPGRGAGEWLLATGSRDYTIRLSSLPTGRLLKTLAGHNDLIISLAISPAPLEDSPEERLLVSGGRDGSIRLWSLPGGKLVKTLPGHAGSVNCLAISPNGRLLASGSLDKTIRLWSLPEGKPLKTLTGHGGAIVSLAIPPEPSGDPGGRLLASGSLDKTIRLWRLGDGALLHTLTGHTEGVMSLAISADGRLLASGSMDQTVRLWAGDLARLSYLPVGRISQEDVTWVQETLERGKVSEAERNWLWFTLALLRWQRRFDIEVEEAPRRISVGEFDIEIEG